MKKMSNQILLSSNLYTIERHLDSLKNSASSLVKEIDYVKKLLFEAQCTEESLQEETDAVIEDLEKENESLRQRIEDQFHHEVNIKN